MEAVAIVSIITSLGVFLGVFSKTIKKSTCCSCLNCETRTPQPSIQYIPPQPSPQPTPLTTPQVVRNNILREVEV
jgi:hypothetical protein